MMRSLMLFLHVSAAMVIVAAFGIEALALLQLRRVKSMGEARVALGSFRYGQLVGGPGLLVTLLTGFYLAGAYWHWQGVWFGLAFAMVIAIALIGAIMTGRRVRALAGASSNPAEGARALAELGRSRAVLDASYALRLSLFLGIVFLMTVKPLLNLALITAAASLALGLAISFPMLRRRAGSVDARQAA